VAVGGFTARGLGDAFVSDAGAVSPVARRRRESRRSLSACAPLVELPAHGTAEYSGCRDEGRRHCIAFALPPVRAPPRPLATERTSELARLAHAGATSVLDSGRATRRSADRGGVLVELSRAGWGRHDANRVDGFRNSFRGRRPWSPTDSRMDRDIAAPLLLALPFHNFR